MTESWEARMAARARERGASFREQQAAEWEANEQRHAKHHWHIGPGVCCSCGEYYGQPSVVLEPWRGDWEPQCDLCETPGVLNWGPR